MKKLSLENKPGGEKEIAMTQSSMCFLASTMAPVHPLKLTCKND